MSGVTLPLMSNYRISYGEGNRRKIFSIWNYIGNIARGERRLMRLDFVAYCRRSDLIVVLPFPSVS